MTIDDIKKAIKSIYNDQPVMAKLCYAQAILESNLDNKISSLALNYKNLFGIKDIDGKNRKEFVTMECNKNKCWKEIQSFEIYSSYEDCIKAHKQLMSKPRYSKVMKATTFEQACSEVAKAGYATDPKYPLKLIQRYKLSGGL